MNALLYGKDDKVMQLVNLAQQPTTDKLFTHYLDHFKTHVLPARLNKKNQPLSVTTLRDYNNQIEHLQRPSALLAAAPTDAKPVKPLIII